MEGDAMNSKRIRQRIMLILGTACVYFLADLPVQLTGFLHFGPYIGIKNFLPTTLGLLFGPYGVIGALIGCTATACILHTSVMETLLEWLCIILPGLGIWFLWHLVSASHKIHFKRAINYFRYLGLMIALYAVCGALSFLFVEGGAFKEIMVSHISLGFLVGIPINILFNGVLCLIPILPPTEYFTSNTQKITLPATEAAVGDMFGFIDDFTSKNAIADNRKHNLQTSLEEILQRILKYRPTSDIHLQVSDDGIFSVILKYDGPPVNPLILQEGEDEIDQAGLLLFMHRILHIGYHCSHSRHIIRFRLSDGLSALLTQATVSWEQFNEQLEEYALSQKVGRKQLFGLQNCLQIFYYILSVRIKKYKNRYFQKFSNLCIIF